MCPIKTIDCATLKDLMDQGKIALVDVREPMEHARESIEGSTLIPGAQITPESLPHAEGKQIVLHCQAGARSEQAAQRLLAAGMEEVTHLGGGLNAWKNAGLPVKFNPKTPLPIIRQVQIIAGTLVLTGVILGSLVDPRWTLLSGFVGAGLLLAGLTGWCGMATLLYRMPWNRV